MNLDKGSFKRRLLLVWGKSRVLTRKAILGAASSLIVAMLIWTAKRGFSLPEVPLNNPRIEASEISGYGKNPDWQIENDYANSCYVLGPRNELPIWRIRFSSEHDRVVSGEASLVLDGIKMPIADRVELEPTVDGLCVLRIEDSKLGRIATFILGDSKSQPKVKQIAEAVNKYFKLKGA